MDTGKRNRQIANAYYNQGLEKANQREDVYKRQVYAAAEAGTQHG